LWLNGNEWFWDDSKERRRLELKLLEWIQYLNHILRFSHWFRRTATNSASVFRPPVELSTTPSSLDIDTDANRKARFFVSIVKMRLFLWVLFNKLF
jgi:hypothetical protein